MANTFITPSVVARTAVGLLSRQIVLPALVWRDFDTEFNGKIGDSVTVRVPAVLSAREYAWQNNRASAITLDDVTESSLTVELDKIPYSAVAVTDEDLDLNIENFGNQILQPQVRAVAEKLESYVAAEMSGATYSTSLELDDDEPFNTLIDAAAALNAADVPRSDRVLVCGSAFEAVLLKSEKVNRVDQSGQASALRDALINRLAGFTIVGSNAIDVNTAYAFHKSAFILATRAPVVPQGAVSGATTSYQGLSVRWIRDYDADHLQDRSVVDAFAGTQTVTDDSALVRAVEIVNESS